jgi:TonB family protein
MASKASADHPDLNLLAAFAEHTLTEKERAAVIAHLGECADCRQLLVLADSSGAAEDRALGNGFWWHAFAFFQGERRLRTAVASAIAVPVVAIAVAYVFRAGPLPQLGGEGTERTLDGAHTAAANAALKAATAYRGYIRSGNTFENVGNYEAALTQYKKAAELSPQFAPAYYNWGNVLEQQGKHEEAIAKYQKAVQLSPKSAAVYYSWGIALRNQGRFAQAEERLRTSIALQAIPASFQSLGITLMYEERNAEATLYLLRAIEASTATQEEKETSDVQQVPNVDEPRVSRSSTAFLYLGIAYRRTGHSADAAAVFRKGLKMAEADLSRNHRDGYAEALAGYFSAAVGNRQNALLAIDAALQRSPEDSTRWLAVLAYGELGMSDEALAVLSTSGAQVVSDASRWPDLEGLRKDPRFFTLRSPSVSNVQQPGSETVQSTTPTPIRQVPPEYTREAIEAKLEGAVILSAIISVDGIPTEIRVLQGLGKGLDEKAVKCLQAWRFKPATSHGEPVQGEVALGINFRLPQTERK